MFSYDTMLQETLKGFFSMEYTYGSLFGDHASIILLVFLPIKLILGKQMIFFLLLLTPLMYLLGGLFLLYYLNKIRANAYFYLLSGLLYAFQLYVFYGNYEGHYGYHVDTGSGYLLMMMAFILVLRYRCQIKNRFTSIVFIVSFVCFALIKEEMALLAIIFFLIVFLFQKDKKMLVFAGISLLILIIEILLIHYSKTNFNRGNNLIFTNLLKTISQKGIIYYFVTPDYNKFWLPFIALPSVFITFCFSNRFNGIALALFLTALAKIAFSFAIDDYEFTGWHSFPALVMLIGSIIIQATEKKKTGNYLSEIVLGLLFIFFIARFFNWDLVNIRSAKGCIGINANYKNFVIKDLEGVKKLVPKDKVIALNGFLAFDFRNGYRYSFYPRGVEMSPCSIADYVLMDKEVSGNMPVTSLNLQLGIFVPNEFDKILENNSFILYKRNMSKGMVISKDRIKFIRYFGKSSIGLK